MSNNFFEKKGPFPVKEIIKNIAYDIISPENKDTDIYDLKPLDQAGKNDITFLNSTKYS